MVIKTITIKKRGGGTRKQKVQVLKSGKFKFIKNSTKSTTKKRSKSTTRKTTKRKAPKRKVIKQKKIKKNVAAKKKGILSNIPLINNPTFKKAALGVGTATLGVTVLSLIAPSIARNPVVRPVLALAGGGVPGVIAQVLSQGGLQGLGLGGNGNGGGFNPGFA